MMRDPLRACPARALLLSILVLGGCRDATGPRTPAEVVIDAPATEVMMRRKLQLTARVLDEDGRLLPGHEVRWYSSDPRVAAVSLTGEVDPVWEGATRITAIAGTARGTLEVRVLHVPISAVELDYGGGMVRPGGLQGVFAAVWDIDGHLVTDRGIEWSVADTTVATIRGTGNMTAEIRGRATGATEIVAGFGEQRFRFPLRVP